MKHGKSRQFRITLVCLLGLSVVACSSGGGTASAGGSAACDLPTEPQTLNLGIIPGSQDLVTYVMQEEGFAEDHNLELDVSEFQNPSALHAAIGQRSVDVGFGGLTAMAVARAQGRGTIVFDVLTGPSNAIFVRSDSDVESLAEVEGGKVGSFGGRGSATYAIAAVVAEEVYGIEDFGETEIIEAPDAALLGLLDEGNIDAALVGTTATVQALLSDKYRPISDVAGDYESEFGKPPGHVTVASYDKFAADNCGLLKAFSAALDDSVEHIQSSDEVWRNYAAEIELDDPEAPEMLKERVASRYIADWDQEQADAEADLIERIIPILGAENFVSEVPEGLFRVDLGADS